MKSRLDKVLDKMPNKKVDLKAHKVALGLVDELVAIKNGDYQGGIDTARKVVDIAKKVNNTLNNLTEDVRFYNTYSSITYEDIGREIEYVQELIDKATAAADELGVDVESLNGFQEAKEFVIDAKSVLNSMNTHTLEFDI